MSPLDSKEIKAVNPKGNQHEYSLKGLTLKPPDVKNQFIRKNSDVGKIEGKGGRGPQRMRWLDSVTESVDMNLSKLLGIVEDRRGCRNGVLQSTGSQSRTRLSN